MSDKSNDRIEHITLDCKNIIRFNSAIEREKTMALEDIVRTGRFNPLLNDEGPYSVSVYLESPERIALDVKDNIGNQHAYSIALQPLKMLVKDYFVMCEALQESLGKANPDRIESIDMARRSIHDEAANIIIEQMEKNIEMCLDTSRRIFTLVCVLHCR